MSTRLNINRRSLSAQTSVFLVLSLFAPLFAVVSGEISSPRLVAETTSTRIMVVGDSISQGSAGDFTWRYRLDRHLAGAGAAVDFVGPRSDLYDNVGGQQGVAGWRREACHCFAMIEQPLARPPLGSTGRDGQGVGVVCGEVIRFRAAVVRFGVTTPMSPLWTSGSLSPP
jgi:hypothetical protein